MLSGLLAQHMAIVRRARERGIGDGEFHPQSIVMAGGGAPRGKVVGSTDKHAGEVKETAISPKDILATTFHLLGIDPHTTVNDQQGKPSPIAGEGRLRTELTG